ncbi:MAG TPA: hypothetical protein VGO47_03700 [Chlamydiales bacterium]|nr:hypothetical protein [Chlamydiales bacterium]
MLSKKLQLCYFCGHTFSSKKNLHLHLRLSQPCKLASETHQQKRHARQPKVRSDARALSEGCENDPPMDWDTPDHDKDIQDVTLAFRQAQDHNQERVEDEGRPPQQFYGVEDYSESDLFKEEFPKPAGIPLRPGLSHFEVLWKRQAEGPWGRFRPFADEEEWELAEWLMTSGTSQTANDKYLKLKIVRCLQLYILPCLRSHSSIITDPESNKAFF